MLTPTSQIVAASPRKRAPHAEHSVFSPFGPFALWFVCISVHAHHSHRHAFRPFGTGAHACLGMRLAQLQLHAMLHHLMRHARLRLPDDYVLKLSPAPSLRPADGLPLRLQRVPR